MTNRLTRRTILAAALATLMLAATAAPALAAYRTDSGGPNGPCTGGRSVWLALRYKGDAYLTYRNKKGTYFNVPLPYHREANTDWRDTHQNGLRWWKLEIVSDQGYVSREGSYGTCG